MAHISFPCEPTHRSVCSEQNTVVRRLGAGPEDGPTAAQRAQATQQLGVLGEMTMGIVHDFRNVLALIESSLRLAESNSNEPEKVHIFIAGAREGVKHAVKLTSRLLTFTKHHNLDVQPADANACLEDLELLLKYGAGPGIQIAFDLAPDIPRCLIDKSQFNAALLNLVINARDAMPDGGVIEINTARWLDDSSSSDSSKPGAYVLVRVKDEGHGMSPEIVERAFDPFFTTKGDRGTGLGLPQVCSFVQEIRGHVRIDSELGVGTIVDLLLPVCEPDAIVLPSGRELAGGPRELSWEALKDGMAAGQLPGVTPTIGQVGQASDPQE